MPSILHAIVLGVVQGLSEFLPISSSGHLALTRWALGWDELSSEEATAFDVAVHAGTLIGAVGYLRDDVLRYSRAALASLVGRRQPDPDGRVAWALAVSAVPAALAGVFAGEALRGSESVALIAVALIVFGLLLAVSDRAAQRLAAADLSFKHALAVGLGQALALQPGVSRSGATMTAARLLGYERAAAVRLAFLMSLPIITGAALYGLADVSVPSSLWPFLAWGAAASAVTGWLSVWATTRLVARLGLTPFVLYRVVLGAAVLIALAVG